VVSTSILADFTPGCTKEACSFRRPATRNCCARSCASVGVSPQDVDSHRRFADRYQHLNFLLLADPDKSVIKAYDLDGPLGLSVRRGTVPDIWPATAPHPRLGAGRPAHWRHEDFVRAAIKSGALKTD